MSGEIEKQRKLPTPEEMQDEELWLLDRQSEHTNAMDKLGITKKVKARLSEFDAGKLTDLSRPSLSLSRKREEEGSVTEVISARFATAGLSTSGHNTTGYVYVPIVEVTDDAMSIESEFTLLEAEAVIDMTAGLKEAKNLGVLPHLSYDLANIHNPLTAITLAPRQEHPPQSDQ
jgi:hypothetical protein